MKGKCYFLILGGVVLCSGEGKCLLLLVDDPSSEGKCYYY